jgi:hypothetical protein
VVSAPAMFLLDERKTSSPTDGVKRYLDASRTSG